MNWLDDTAWEAELNRRRPPTLGARARAVWTTLRRHWLFWLTMLLALVYALVVNAANVPEQRLYAFSARDGQVRWSAVLPGGLVDMGIPAVGGNRVVMLTEDEERNPMPENSWQFTAFDAETGRPLWQQTSAGSITQMDARLGLFPEVAPHLTADHAFLEGRTSRGPWLATFDLADGRLVKDTKSALVGRNQQRAAVASAAGYVLMPIRDDRGIRLAALDERDWSERWSVFFQTAFLDDVKSGPFFAATPDLVYVVQREDVVAYDAATGTPRFQLDRQSDDLTGQLAVDGDTLYRRVGRNTIDAFDAATGQRRWTYTRPFVERDGELGGFGVADGVLVAYCTCDGERQMSGTSLIALDAATGRERWRLPVDKSTAYFFMPPLLVGDVVVTRADDRSVVARATADGSVRWHVPRKRGRTVAGSGELVYASDVMPRWRHWLASFGYHERW